FRARATTHVRVDAGMAVLVVGSALLAVRQHFVGFLDLLELGLGVLAGVAVVAVRVVLHRSLAISLLDFILAGVLGNAEGFVIVAFSGHVSRSSRAAREAEKAGSPPAGCSSLAWRRQVSPS